MSISDKVLHTIEEKNIQPAARWKFVLHNIVIWLLGIIAVAIGTVGVSTLLHIVSDSDWDVYQHLGKTFFQYVIAIFPYFWLVVLVLFVSIAYLILKRTKIGYRYTMLIFFGTAFLISVLLGTILFLLGMGQYVDDALSQNIDIYATLPHNKTAVWSQPDVGLLSGTITEIVDENEFILNDFSNQEWVVIEDDATWIESDSRAVGEKVKLLGSYENDGVFIVTEIRPWEATKPKVK